MKKSIVTTLLILCSLFATAQLKHALRDENGRHMIGRGFVVVTNDSHFDGDDYTRMLRLGANCQVIRLELGRLSTFPGAQLEADYLLQLDGLVRLAKEKGIKSIFKMTMYGVESFAWENYWVDKDNMQEKYLDAWKVIWDRYKDEPFVIAYDLVNEPRKHSMDITYHDLTNEYLVPNYQMLVDEAQKVNREKYCMVQTIFMNKGDKINGSQYAPIEKPIARENLLFAPHIYQENKHLVKPTLLRFSKESDFLNAPVFIGEWGFPTFTSTDTTMTGRLGQLNYMDFYMRTAELFDSLGYNTIKAWFSGNPKMQNFLPGGPSTWAIFSDNNAVGNVERKYIVDIIARPYPQAIAGDLYSFKYDFATRCLDIHMVSDNSKGASQIFIGANRHYPDGFSIDINDEITLCHDPIKHSPLEVYKCNGIINPSNFIWDEQTQRLTILEWPVDQTKLYVRIKPGINY